MWRHVFIVEILKHHSTVWKGPAKSSIIEKIRSRFVADKDKKALDYLETWGSTFWEETEYRIKEVTTKLENDLQGSVVAGFPSISFALSAVGKLSGEEKSEIIHRAQRVINTVQIRQLSEIIDLTDKVLSDPQKRYFIVIDGLDENWIEDRLRYRLIRALIETVKDFRKIRHAKIVVALRLDLIEKVFKLTRDSGFQEEKYESFYLPIIWTGSDLAQMLDFRINHLIKRRYTKKTVTHKDVLPSKIDRKPPFEYILNRSMMRPRDIIMFFNCCIEKAAGKATISLSALREAEGVYSRNRLRSIADEWVSDYPNLLHFTSTLKSRKAVFGATEITQQDIEDICLDFCISHPNPINADIFSTAAKELLNTSGDLDNFRKILLQVFYRTGLIGLKLETFEKAQWATLGARSVSKSELSDGIKVSIHPMFWRTLGTHLR